MISEQRYNQRVRQAISDKYVEYSKMYADTHQEMLEVEAELRAKNAKKNLSYEQYVDMSKMYAPSYKEWKESRYKLFNEKINHFSQYPEYGWLREYADAAMSANGSFGLAMIAGTDFIERIECMPLDYIKDWLDHKNGLEWRECDRRMLKALKGGFAHLLGKYPNHVISRINSSAADFYKKCGYKIITEGNNVYAIKEEN